jgi:hypothetical protein
MASSDPVVLRKGVDFDLEFDHIDRSAKVIEVTSILKGNLPDLIAELDKCQLLCTGCHAVKTARERLDNITHGKQWAVTKLGCRCAECVAWIEKSNADRREKRTGVREKKVREHGTYAMYKAGCRLECCRSANREYMARRRGVIR